MFLRLQDKAALTAIRARTLTDDAMKFMSLLLKLEGLSPDLFNGSSVFRRWLDKGCPKRIFDGIETDPKALEREDLRRKNLLLKSIGSHINSSHNMNRYHQGFLDGSPSLKAACLIYDSPDALDALTMRKYIVREEGNFSAHNLISFEQFAEEILADDTYLKEGPAQAMKVFVEVFKCLPKDTVPQLSPPAESALLSLNTAPPPSPSSAAMTPAPPSAPVSAWASGPPSVPGPSSAPAPARASASASRHGAPGSVPRSKSGKRR